MELPQPLISFITVKNPIQNNVLKELILVFYSDIHTADHIKVDILFNLQEGKSDIVINIGDACGVMVIVVGNGHCDTSSNPGRDWLHFT